ncbi:hypothetical protein HanRHA438_Chr03g0149851 [Helianthus annuus]|nr:hypothetical protein HanRHA438_Chr03g0149851 [Helianthus annuus]
MHGPLFGRLMPLNTPLSSALFMITSSASIANMNRKGDSGSPCLSPLCSLNSDVGEPFTKTDAQLDFKHAPIHFVHRLGNFIALRLDKRNFQLIES